MLRVDLRELRRGVVETAGRLEPDAPVFAGLDLTLSGPVEVSGQLQATGDGEFLWRGRVQGRVARECRRCLRPVEREIAADVDVLFSMDPDAADDPSVYPLARTATQVDVSEAVREELALAAPGWLLCREDCAGLCAGCGADLNAGPCACARTAEPV